MHRTSTLYTPGEATRPTSSAPEPKMSTLAFLRQFARAYQPVNAVQPCKSAYITLN